MPSVALISATPEPTWCSGNSSRMMLMPNGTTPTAAPCNTRPTSTAAKSSLTAPIALPTPMMAREISSIRRLPYMSPSRPATGAHTEPATSDAVTSQPALDGVVPRSLGNSGSSGTTRVCINDTAIPHDASTAMTIFERPGAAGEAGVALLIGLLALDSELVFTKQVNSCSPHVARCFRVRFSTAGCVSITQSSTMDDLWRGFRPQSGPRPMP